MVGRLGSRRFIPAGDVECILNINTETLLHYESL